MRHQHTFSSTSDYALQVFYDFYERDEFFLKESRHSLDVDFQHRFGLLEWNDVVWGLGYRYNHDDFDPINTSTLNSESRNDQLFSAFIQDEITLLDDMLWLTIGSKFEHNDYSGFEIQPTARLMWAPHQQHRVWGAVSKSVRTPSRLEHDMGLLHTVVPAQPPASPAIAVSGKGNRDFNSEEVMSYEVGYRTTFIKDVSIDFTAFYNSYHELRSLDLEEPVFTGTYVNVPVGINNNLKAHTYGFEIATVWQMLDWWRWDANYSLLKTDYNRQDGIDQYGSSPQQRVSLRSAMAPWENIDIDLLFRYVDENVATSTSGTAFIKDYVSMDIRLAWRPINDIEVSLVGQNLLAEQHLEYRQEVITKDTSIDRGIYGKLVWQF
jgi:iron complex outermembrane receptor protein